MNEKADALLGKQVKVTVDASGYDQLIVTGRLLSFSEDGEVVTRDSDGVVWHSWPMLQIEEA